MVFTPPTEETPLTGRGTSIQQRELRQVMPLLNYNDQGLRRKDGQRDHIHAVQERGDAGHDGVRAQGRTRGPQVAGGFPKGRVGLRPAHQSRGGLQGPNGRAGPGDQRPRRGRSRRSEPRGGS